MDLVVVNLYPFEETVAREDTTLAQAIEEIDIGGVTLIRAAAKNFHHVGVVVDPADYPELLEELRAEDGLSLETRGALALKAFRHTAHYDAAISGYLAQGEGRLPQELRLELVRAQGLRYGENPHQEAAFYRLQGERGLPDAVQLQGSELSFNNILDLDAAWRSASEFEAPTAAVIKHNNPCGLASHAELSQAYLLARECDPQAAFGSVVGFNREVDEATARLIVETVVHGVIAPGFTAGALEALKRRRNMPVLSAPEAELAPAALDFRRVWGGMLAQEGDAAILPGEPKVVSEREPTPEEREGLLFAWKVAKHVKSNAIVLAQGTVAVGIGAGQMKRVDSVRIALAIAGERAQGAVLASDAMFPFPDNIEEAARGGITAFIQPGGSLRDEEVVAAADRHGAAMLLTGMRHFRH
jgi:phosphoribosylaminoimidazolecarboxamide formyltransferase/IMP cyclohydrolase